MICERSEPQPPLTPWFCRVKGSKSPPTHHLTKPQPLAAGPLQVSTSMHSIDVIQVDSKYALVVDNVVVLYTSNANIARSYAQQAKLHYTSSSEPYTIVLHNPRSSTSVRK